MRDYQQQLVDLQNVVIRGMRRIVDNQKGLRHLVLRGEEGRILFDLCQLIAVAEKDETQLEIICSMEFEGFPVICQ